MKIAKDRVKTNFELGMPLQSERQAVPAKLSHSNELASARDCELSTTINYTNATGANEGSSANQTEGEVIHSHRINFYPSVGNGSALYKRSTVGSSQPVGSNGQK
jgi:hypothetical protein